jgi:hypothetical protein
MKQVAVAVGVWMALSACDKSNDLDAVKGAAPPPKPSAKVGVCRGGGGKVDDAVTAKVFPRQSGNFCIDPNGETRAYGAGTTEGIDKVCLEQFDGECELYKSYGLDRLVTLRYVHGDGAPAMVSVNLSRFKTLEGAYGFFTRRLVGGADPLDRAPKALHAGTAGGMGAGSATVWRGVHVAELVYTNELEPTERVIELGRAALAPIAQAIGEALPGEKVIPAAARALPANDRVPMGVRYEVRDVLGVTGAGGGALGYYQSGKQRWRVLSIAAPDQASAKDVLETLQKGTGATREKGLTFKALRFALSSGGEGPKAEWFVARSAEKVFGVGDEEYVLTSGTPAEQLALLKLNREQKLERLQKLLDGPAAAPQGAAAASASRP